MTTSSEITAQPTVDLPALATLPAQEPQNIQTSHAPTAASSVVEIIGRIVRISERLFPGPVSFEYSFDPEDPSDEWLVFDVTAKGEYADYRDREFEWHEEVEKIIPDTLCEFRLCIMPQR